MKKLFENKWLNSAILGIRAIEVLCFGFVISGALWASSDLLLATVLIKSPVTPLSVLFMLYGIFGLVISEGTARMLSRRQKQNSQQRNP